jgi:DNA-directed RNA polymerase specialized sigma24 family protein
MQELDDTALLREYADLASERAFATLVARHVNQVYSVALRHTRNPQDAGKITQAVFVILAGKARRLGRGVILSGWLHQTARLASLTFIRSQIRRARREQEAHMQTSPPSGPLPRSWRGTSTKFIRSPCATPGIRRTPGRLRRPCL